MRKLTKLTLVALLTVSSVSAKKIPGRKAVKISNLLEQIKCASAYLEDDRDFEAIYLAADEIETILFPKRIKIQPICNDDISIEVER